MLDKKSYTLIFILLSCMSVVAQDVAEPALKSEEINVVKDFNPLIIEATKVSFPPTIPERTREKYELIYTIPAKKINISFTPASLKPLAVAKERPREYQSSYLKVGFGTQLSPLFELMYNDGDNKKYNYGAFLKHFSSRATKIKHQNFNDTKASVYGNYFFKNAQLGSEIAYSRDAVFYYGFHADSTINEDTVKKSNIKQYFNELNWNSRLSNIKAKSSFKYDAKFNLGYFDSKSKIQEFHLGIDVDFEKTFKNKHYLTVNLKEDYFTIKRVSTKNRNIFRIKPMYEYNDLEWRIFGGIDATWEDGIFHLYPDLGLERALFKQYIILYNGWKMETRVNSYKSLINENPYLRDSFELRNPWYEDRYLGLKGTVKNFTYNVRMSQRLIRRQPLFINDANNGSKFEVIYEKKLSTLNIHTEFSYRIHSNLNFMLAMDYFNYETEVEKRAWHLPRFLLNFSTQYNIGDKVFLRGELFVRDAGFAKLADGTSQKLNGTFDISLSATYKFSQYLSFFCTLNNIASIKYERWLNYPNYGFNGMIGATLTF